MRVTCEDGRDFIQSVTTRCLVNPFPAYTGPKPSIKKQRKLQKQQTSLESVPVDVTDSPAIPPRRRISHFVMNLPDSAITFLNAFRGIFSASSLGGMNVDAVYDTMPMIHCHCFTREIESDKAEVDIRQVKSPIPLPSYSAALIPPIQRVTEQLGHPLGDETTLHMVRSVAPNKDMYCISFRLPREVAFA